MRVRTRTGVELCIRPLRPDDRVREIAFINSLSERTRFLRVLAPLRFLPPHLLDQLMDVDYDARMAFVATIMHDGVEEFIGVARYGPTDEPRTVEMAITVTDAWQRRGIARPLLQQLIRYARARGYLRMCGYVLPENHPMLALARTFGFQVCYSPGEHLTHISLDLMKAASTDPASSGVPALRADAPCVVPAATPRSPPDAASDGSGSWPPSFAQARGCVCRSLH